MRVRRADATDADAVAGVFLASRAASMPYLPVLHTAQDTRRWLRDVVLTGHRVWVADDGRVLGFAAVRDGWLDHLYVHPEYTGRGAGSALLAAVRASGAARLRLRAFRRNVRAAAFYERHGFRLLDVDDGSRNEEGEPDATYVWP